MAFDLSSAEPVGSTPGKFDLASAKPVGEPTASAKAKAGTDESPTSFRNLFGAATEPLLAMGSGAAGAVTGGLAGLGTAAGRAVGLTNKQPGDVSRSVQAAMTYEPTTEGGKTATEAITYPFRKLGEVSEAAGGKVTDIAHRAGMSPELAAIPGTAVSTGLQALPQLLGSKGAGALAERPGVLPRLMPKPSETVTRLQEGGVKNLTPGQLFGGGWDRAEQMVSKWPLVGAPIRAARARAFEQFNEAAWNDVLDPVGDKVPAGMSGHKATEYAREKLGARYDDLLDKSKGSLGGVAPKPKTPGTSLVPRGQAELTPREQPQAPTLRGELDNLRSMMGKSKMPKKYVQEFNRILDEDVIGRFEKGSGLASGRTVKDIESKLYSLEKSKAINENRDVRAVGQAIHEVRAAIKRMTERENPELAPQLRKTDAAWAKFKIAQRASAAAGKEGTFTPAQFERSVKAKDPTKDKRAFAEGKANMQDLSKAAQDVLGDIIPDSGTPAQIFLAAMLSHHGAGLLGIPGGLAASTALSLPYSKLGTGMLNRAAMGGPSVIGPAAARALPFGAGSVANQLQPRPGE